MATARLRAAFVEIIPSIIAFISGLSFVGDLGGPKIRLLLVPGGLPRGLPGAADRTGAASTGTMYSSMWKLFARAFGLIEGAHVFAMLLLDCKEEKNCNSLMLTIF